MRSAPISYGAARWLARFRLLSSQTIGLERRIWCDSLSGGQLSVWFQAAVILGLVPRVADRRRMRWSAPQARAVLRPDRSFQSVVRVAGRRQRTYPTAGLSPCKPRRRFGGYGFVADRNRFVISHDAICNI